MMTLDEFVLVELEDGVTCRMAKKAFNIFLSHGRITRFRRSDGWVAVDSEKLRKKPSNSCFAGTERREAC